MNRIFAAAFAFAALALPGLASASELGVPSSGVYRGPRNNGVVYKRLSNGLYHLRAESGAGGGRRRHGPELPPRGVGQPRVHRPG